MFVYRIQARQLLSLVRTHLYLNVISLYFGQVCVYSYLIPRESCMYHTPQSSQHFVFVQYSLCICSKFSRCLALLFLHGHLSTLADVAFIFSAL